MGLAMKKISSVLVVGLALVLATTAVTYAAPGDGRRFDGRAGSWSARRDFRAPVPRHFDRPGFDGHRRFFHGHGRAFFGVAPFIAVAPFAPYWYAPPVEVAPPPAPAYWYYCPSAGAYYPNVQSCPEPWVTVPAN